MDIIFIRGLAIDTIIGIHPWERTQKQPVVFDLELATDNRKAAKGDSIADTIDYHAVSQRLLEFVGQSRFQLIETLAEEVAAILLREFGAPWVRLRLTKPQAVPEARGGVGVEIERGEVRA